MEVIAEGKDTNWIEIIQPDMIYVRTVWDFFKASFHVKYICATIALLTSKNKPLGKFQGLED